MSESVTRARFEAALRAVVEEVRGDRHILAAILCGSLSHDEVWDKSDIDLVLICTDDRKSARHHLALVQDDINIHATVQPRAEFRRRLDAAVRNTFEHALFAKAKLLFSRDPSIAALLAGLNDIGARDRRIQGMRSAQHALGCLYKARKWYAIKQDPAYTAFWVLLTARALAEVEVGQAGELVDREALVAARRLNPVLFRAIYTDLLEKPVTRERLGAALDAIDRYLQERAERLFEPILDYLRDAGGAPRSGTDIMHHFHRHHGTEDVIVACEWLADIGVIEKASTPRKLTTASQMDVEELAFFRGAW